VHDTEGEWIAKFPSVTRDATHDVVGLEATCLELAHSAGLLTAQSRLQAVGNRRVLLVRRFDVTPQGGRLHMVSMRTLCKERPGIYVNGYSDLARVLDKHSAAPPADVTMLFRHMVFNAAIGNVDDHLKNFWVLATPSGYRLAPAFDLVPDITGRGEHTLSFQYQFECPQAEQLSAIASEWKVSNTQEIIDQVTVAVGEFGSTARKLEVGGGEALEKIQADIRWRLQLINPKRRFDRDH
jgi:serine/threonine-protein kinase HipA